MRLGFTRQLGFTGLGKIGGVTTAGDGAGELISGCQHWWKLDEGSGNDFSDYGSGSKDASMHGMAENIWAYTGPDGNPVATFFGAHLNDFANNIGNTTVRAGSANEASMTITVAFYCKEVHSGSQYTICGKTGGASANWEIKIQDSRLHFDFGNATEARVVMAGHNISASTWYVDTVVVTFDEVYCEAQWYRGGSAVSTHWEAGQDTPARYEDCYLIIGGHSSDDTDADNGCIATLMFNGLLGDIVIYNKDLAAGDVSSNYDVLKSRYDLS